MSGMILCRSEYSQRPYYIEGAAVNVYSIEEICYFLYHDIYLVGADFFCEDLFLFIEKDIKEPELAKRLRFLSEQRAGLAELVLTILRYVDFYSDDEIASLGNLIDRLDTQNAKERLKARADNYLENRRYNSAISNYEEIVYGKYDSSLGEVFYGDVWNNMGVAYARLMIFDKASECFRQGYSLNHNEDTHKQYWIARHLVMMNSDGNEDIESIEGLEDEELDEENELMYVTGRELETYLDNVTSAEGYSEVARILECKKNGQVKEYYDRIDKLLEQWKDEYRDYIK